MILDQPFLDIDDEAMLYHIAYYHPNEGNCVEMKKVEMKKAKQRFSRNSSVVCYRCGGIGHISSSCQSDIPSINDLQEMVDNDINNIIDQVSQSDEYQSDESGLYLKSKVQISCLNSWKNGKFCHNCGYRDHSTGDCRKATLSQLIDKLKLGTKEKEYSSKKIEERFFDLWDY